MSTFWSLWVIVLTLITLVGTTWLLFANNKSTGTGPDKTTGHSYDGIEEYDNPLPAWWLYLFLLTIVFSVFYLIAYPGMGNFKGVLGWSQVQQLEADVAKAQARYGPLFDKYAQMPIEEVIQDSQALKMGQRVFANNCAQCHGSDAKGGYGFPDLTDQDWLFGGTPEQIKASIVNGRVAAMPPWQDILQSEGVEQVTAYVLTLSGRSADEAKAAAGKQQYATYCAACHGVDGKGMQVLGAPNLTDDIWLYGKSPMLIAHTIRNGRNGQMPAHKDLLSEQKIHLLTAYVYNLSQ